MYLLSKVIRPGLPVLIVFINLVATVSTADPGKHRDQSLQGEYMGVIDGEHGPKKMGVQVGEG